MTPLTAYIEGIGLIGPGLPDWPAACAILCGQAAYDYQPAVLPAPASLPPAERRRCGPIVKLTLAVGHAAALAAQADVRDLATVYTASGGDGVNCHEICAMLASDDRQISPTRFHNSVHNAASGYWNIAAASMASASVLCAYDASFGAGLLEAMVQVAADATPVLLLACDTSYPEPIRAVRPIPGEFGIGLVLAPRQGPRSIARLQLAFADAPGQAMADAGLEFVRAQIPAARSLPLLQALARGQAARVLVDYLDAGSLRLDVAPCN